MATPCRMPSTDTLSTLQLHLHDLIRSRAGDQLDGHDRALPDLLNEPPSGRPVWFAVPGMNGGFSYRLAPDDPPRLIVESWSRTVAGSGRRHVITADGWELVEAGFV